jgi:hypothetical protein
MNRCDWAHCKEEGIFDGVTTVLLNSEGRENIPPDENRARFIYLCPEHFAAGIGTLGTFTAGALHEESRS